LQSVYYASDTPQRKKERFMRQLLLVIFAGLTLLSQVAVAQIDRPLNDDQKTFVKAHAPKLILPGCIDWLDSLAP